MAEYVPVGDSFTLAALARQMQQALVFHGTHPTASTSRLAEEVNPKGFESMA